MDLPPTNFPPASSAATAHMGTTLMEVADVPFDRCLEEFCLSAPDLVAKIHGQYIDAGARVIETNSFGANAVRLLRHGLEHRVANSTPPPPGSPGRPRRATEGVYVAGSVGPLGHHRRRGARTGHRPPRRVRGADHVRCSTAAWT